MTDAPQTVSLEIEISAPKDKVYQGFLKGNCNVYTWQLLSCSCVCLLDIWAAERVWPSVTIIEEGDENKVGSVRRLHYTNIVEKITEAKPGAELHYTIEKEPFFLKVGHKVVGNYIFYFGLLSTRRITMESFDLNRLEKMA